MPRTAQTKQKRKNKCKGKLVVFEGIDGSGKTTQAALLKSYLDQIGIDSLIVADFKEDKIGKKIRSIITHDHTIYSLAEIFLIAAARSQLIKDVIKPELAAGKIVICDRFVDSTYAYQANALSTTTIDSIMQLCMQDLVPDCTIYLDLPVPLALQRIKQRVSDLPTDKFERRDDEFFAQVQRVYRARMQHNANSITIDASINPLAIKANICEQVAQKLQLHNVFLNPPCDRPKYQPFYEEQGRIIKIESA